MNISIFRYNLPVLCCEFYKEESHPFEELIRITSECGEGFLGNLAEELLRVHLATTHGSAKAPQNRIVMSKRNSIADFTYGHVGTRKYEN